MTMIRIGFAVALLFAMLPHTVVAQAIAVSLTHTAVNVTTSTGEVSAADVNRGFLLIINDSNFVIYCKVGVAAVLNEGIRLNASGGSFEMSRGNRNLDADAVNCIHGDSGNKVLLVTEG